MNSIISNDNLGTTKNWKFLRDDLLSIFAADDARLLEKYDNDEQMDKLFDELAKEYLDNFTVSGFCIDAEDNVSDVLEMIMALSSLVCHPFGWGVDIIYDKDGHFDMIRPHRINFSHRPHVFMIDVSNSGDNYTKEFVEILDEYMTLWGYGRMDLVYENRLVYINKVEYSSKTKEATNIRDSVNNNLYTVRFNPYTFKHQPDIDNINKAIVTLFKTEMDTSCNTESEVFDILFTGEKSVDEEIRYTVLRLCDALSDVPRILPTDTQKFSSSSIETTETENGLRVTITTVIKNRVKILLPYE